MSNKKPIISNSAVSIFVLALLGLFALKQPIIVDSLEPAKTGLSLNSIIPSYQNNEIADINKINALYAKAAEKAEKSVVTVTIQKIV